MVTHPVHRLSLLACGWAALTLGVIGLALPVLPTAPFILLAAACFMRSSERLHRYLTSHRRFGPMISDYLAGRGISARSKACALAALWSSVTFSALVFVPVPWGDAAIVLAATAVSAYILRQPTAATST